MGNSIFLTAILAICGYGFLGSVLWFIRVYPQWRRADARMFSAFTDKDHKAFGKAAVTSQKCRWLSEAWLARPWLWFSRIDPL